MVLVPAVIVRLWRGVLLVLRYVGGAVHVMLFMIALRNIIVSVIAILIDHSFVTSSLIAG